MIKDFSGWHILKTSIEQRHRVPFFREREIWWCSLGWNIGTEEDGKSGLFQRPVIIFRKFNKELFWGIPLTSKKKEGIFYHSLPMHDGQHTVILSQLRVLNSKRLLRRMGKISWEQFALLDDSFIGLLKETDPLRDPRVPSGNCI